jgi:hypothetical protein
MDINNYKNFSKQSFLGDRALADSMLENNNLCEKSRKKKKDTQYKGILLIHSISYPASSFYGREPTKKQYLKTSSHPPSVSLGSILLYP